MQDGGRVPGDILTVYAAAPPGAAVPDFRRGAKLALAEAQGQVGRFTVQFASKELPPDEDGTADAVEEIVRDVATIAVIEHPDAESSRVTAPLLNAVGLLHVSTGPPQPSLAQPAARRSFFALDSPVAPAPGGFAAAFPGARPGPAARGGYDAMNGVLAALRRAGPRAAERSEVIEAFAAEAT